MRRAGDRVRITVAAGERRRRLPAVGRALRPHARGRVRGAGGDRRLDREGAGGRAHAERGGEDRAGQARRRARLRPVPQGTGTVRPATRPESLGEALELFEQAIAIDPNYARAWAGVADCYGQMVQWGGHARSRGTGATGPRGRPQGDRTRSPTGGRLQGRGLALRFGGDRDAARISLHRAVEADPRYNAGDHQPGRRSLLAGGHRGGGAILPPRPRDRPAGALRDDVGPHHRAAHRPAEEVLRLAARLRTLSGDAFYRTAADSLEIWRPHRPGRARGGRAHRPGRPARARPLGPTGRSRPCSRRSRAGWTRPPRSSPRSLLGAGPGGQ